MKTVSMGTSAREGARGERRQSLAHVLQLLLQEEDLSLSLSPRRDGMEPVFHTHIHADVHGGVGRRGLSGGGRDGRRRQVYVCTHCRESLPGRSCRRGALNTTLSRHP